MKYALTILALALLTGVAGAACPASDYDLYGSPLTVTGPFGNDYYNFNDGYGDTGTSAMDFNIPSALLETSVTSYGYAQSTAMLDVVDDFHIVGLPDGTPVNLVVHLGLDGDGSNSMTGPASVMGSVHDNAGHSASTTGISYHGTLNLPLTENAGAVFRLTFSVQSTCYLNASTGMTGHFSFTGLPTGGTVVSCEGFVSDPTVPTRPLSWGKLKTLYH